MPGAWNARSFESVAARRRMPIAMALKAEDGRRPAQVLQVTESYFRVLASLPFPAWALLPHRKLGTVPSFPSFPVETIKLV